MNGLFKVNEDVVMNIGMFLYPKGLISYQKGIYDIMLDPKVF